MLNSKAIVYFKDSINLKTNSFLPRTSHSRNVGNNLKMTKGTTNKILLINVILIVLMFIANEFWTELGLTDSENIYYALIGIIIFGISTGGIFVGIKELKTKGNKTLIGLIGNSILTLLFLIAFFYIALTMER